MARKRSKKTPSPCYWCGSPSNSSEHVPPKNLFPPGHRKNLLTVPACQKHNFDLKRFDEEIKPVLVVGGGSPLALGIWKDVFKRRLTETRCAREFLMQVRLVTATQEPRLAVFPERQLLGGFAEKVFRALCYHHTGELSGQLNLVWTWHVEPPIERVKPELLTLFERERSFFTPGDSRNPDVFSYYFKDALNEGEPGMFLLWGFFYGGFQLLGCFTKPSARAPRLLA